MIAPSKGEIESSLGDFESKEFGLEITDKTFVTLFANLYQDKVYSPMRELATNAYDSHIMAGNTDPFEINLPTVLDPNFSVRDYGTGLTHVQIMGDENTPGLYTTAFATTKAETNNQVGYLGLGSKSFFAYVDSAQLTSFQNGTKYNYIASLNERRIPQVTFINSEPTTEADGFKIAYAAKAGAAPLFLEAGKKVLAGFRGCDIQPVFNDNVTVEQEELLLDLPGIQVTTRNAAPGSNRFYQRHYDKKIFIRQGCILYPITASDSDWLQSGNTLILTVPVGTVEVAASRETLSLDARTAEKVKNLLNDAKLKITSHVEKQLQKELSYASACSAFWGGELSRLINPNAGKFFYSDATGTLFELASYIKVPDKVLLAFKPGSSRYEMSVTARNLGKVRVVYTEPGEKYVRIKDRFAGYHSQIPTEKYFVKDLTDEQKTLLKETLGLLDDQFVSMDTIPDPGPRYYASTASKGTTNSSSTRRPYRWVRSDQWEQTEVPTDGNYFWLPVDKKYGSIKMHMRASSWQRNWTTIQFERNFIGEVGLLAAALSLPELTCTTRNPSTSNTPLLLVTPKLGEKLDLPLEKRYDVAIGNILDSELNKKVYQAFLAHRIEKSKTSRVAFSVANLDQPMVDTVNYRVSDYFLRNFFTEKQMGDLNNKVDTQYKKLLAKYPLLFGDGVTKEAYEDYINMANKTRKRKVS